MFCIAAIFILLLQFFSARCNSRCVLLRLHDIPDPWWMAGIAFGRGPVVWNCNSCGVYIYFIDSNGNSMEPHRSDCSENLRRISAGELGKFDKKKDWYLTSFVQSNLK